ncbi:response regulator [Faecalicatena sp. AGMB00832]|uniref:Response regulator n=1 Tax=Faecalicatena faecalis TaxID=2726362 RepID=A0ABS6D8E3_9FIRM|nr:MULTISPECIES: response regulator [Faecalicatena]MBU3877875.1 response regulator [Faecalicatena faecalis]MCI6465443.1 response regulator [Faecalicatena sp.]MDY5617275.1 response regulator [Lachnospiraceae bacterium]
MYKVVIIDDEPIIVEGLSRVIKWEEYGCRLAGTAYDGMDGVNVIREQKPDIIFSDIAMPGMDGLKMIAAIKVEQPDAMIAILTGYRDFDYAQTAIRLGVCRFLLKPSNLSELEEAVQFMVSELKKKHPEEAKEEKAEGAEDSEGKDSEGTAGSFIVKNALEYMESHYAEKITLSELADKMYVSQWHLSKLLNKHTKKSFSELLNEIRVKEAKQLLKDPSLRVGDVAEMVGFLDIAHFSRVFKKCTEMSANEYRNKKLG